jgi:hypothetical protein
MSSQLESTFRVICQEETELLKLPPCRLEQSVSPRPRYWEVVVGQRHKVELSSVSLMFAQPGHEKLDLAYPDVIDESPDILFVLLRDALEAFNVCLFEAMSLAFGASKTVGSWPS